MKIFFDFFPAVIFFAAYKLLGIYWATFTLILMTYLQIAFLWIKNKQIDTIYKIMLLFVTLFGGATLALHNELYIKWKPTVINWLFAMMFLGSNCFSEKTMLERLLESKVTLSQSIWKKLNGMWIGFFVLMGAINIYVAYQYSTDAWVNFKVFGVLGFTLLFSVLQGMYLAKYIRE